MQALAMEVDARSAAVAQYCAMYVHYIHNTYVKFSVFSLINIASFLYLPTSHEPNSISFPSFSYLFLSFHHICVPFPHNFSCLTFPCYFWLIPSQYGGNRQSSEEPEHLSALRGITESVYPPMAARMISGALQGRCVCDSVCVCVRGRKCVYVCIFMWVYLCMHVCMYACMYVWAFTHCCVWNLGSWSPQ